MTDQNQWQEVQPGIWKPEADGDSIQGVLIAKRTKVGANESNAYDIECGPDKLFMVWGSTVLDDRMNFVNVGDKVRITYKGTETNKKGQPVKIFKIERQKAQ